jgi:phage head maturation protease
MRLYGNIQKVDTEQRMVFGYASTEATDAHGESVLKSAIEDALDDYLEFANIREMHQLSAVGTTEEASVDDKGLYIGAKIVDDIAWGKVTSGVYKGFSIGGKTLARDPDDKKIITKVRLDEISLVDRPSNPEARFDVWKAAGSAQEDDMAKKDQLLGSTSAAAMAVPQAAKAPSAIDAQQLEKTATGAAAEDANGAVAATTEGTETSAETTGGVAKTTSEGNVAEGSETAAETEAASVDPITKATTALDKIDAAVAAVTKTDDLEKGLYAVGRFAEVLESISNLAQNAEYEAEMEADNSPVPAKLRDWVKAGAAIFKDMAKEEVDELVAAGNVKKAAAAEAITGQTAATGTEDLHKVTSERNDLAKALAEKDEALTKLADRIEPLAKTVEDLVATNADLAKRLATVEAQPAPAKTAGAAAAISKEEDASGSASLEKSVPSEEDIAKVLAAMSDEDRALLLIKASRQLPRAVTYRS